MAVSPSTIWLGRAVFASLGLISTLIAMLPMGLSAEANIMADLFFCIVFAWVIRRPSTAPMGMVLVIALLGDFLLMRPLGLWAFIVLMASELLTQSSLACCTGSFGFVHRKPPVDLPDLGV